MQQDLQLTLTIIGVLIIGGVLIHGLWSTRKKTTKSKKSMFESHDWEHDIAHDDDANNDAPIYDDIGIGRARVVINPSSSSPDLNKVQSGLDDFESEFSASNHNHDDFSLNPSDEQLMAETEFDASSSQSESFLGSELPEEQSRNASDFSVSTDSDSVEQDEELDIDSYKQSSPLDVTIDDPQISETSEAHHPMYSNVVTQPKPTLHKSANSELADDEDNFGKPPSFLLKKNHKQNAPNPSSKIPTLQATPISESGRARSAVDGPISAQKETNFSLNIQEGPAGKSENEDALPQNVEKELSFAEQAKRFVRRNKKSVADKIRKEPEVQEKSTDEQMRIDFEESSAKASSAHAEASEKVQSPPRTTQAKQATDVLVLNVRASDENPIQGAALLPMLLTLGFKFGEHDIFHRHVTTNGKGPILFSLTNMFKPGVFDIDSIETFSTYGLSLFMMLPIEGDAQQVFNMMHNAARKISEEFACRILDGNKVGLSKQSLQQYVERIREFERKRINR